MWGNIILSPFREIWRLFGPSLAIIVQCVLASITATSILFTILSVVYFSFTSLRPDLSYLNIYKTINANLTSDRLIYGTLIIAQLEYVQFYPHQSKEALISIWYYSGELTHEEFYDPDLLGAFIRATFVHGGQDTPRVSFIKTVKYQLAVLKKMREKVENFQKNSKRNFTVVRSIKTHLHYF